MENYQVILANVTFAGEDLPVTVVFNELATADGTFELKVKTCVPLEAQGEGAMTLYAYDSNGEVIRHSYSRVSRVKGHEMTMHRERPPMTFVTTFRSVAGCQRSTDNLGVCEDIKAAMAEQRKQ